MDSSETVAPTERGFLISSLQSLNYFEEGWRTDFLSELNVKLLKL